jgi:hypothetical protein
MEELLQASRRTLLLLAVQVLVADPVSQATQETAAMAASMAAQAVEVAQGLTVLETLALEELEQTVLLLSQPTFNHAIRYC